MINPIIPGFAPDPSAIRVGDTFYLVNSTFHVFPGLPIYVSKDLLSWKQIGNAFNRQSQLSLAHASTSLGSDGVCANGGLYAPTIRHKDGTFYVVCTNVQHGKDPTENKHQNFILTSTDIWGDVWSDPVIFEFDGIDTSIFWDDDGRAYLHGSAAPGPMTTIRMFEIDLQTGKKLTEEKLIWKGTGGIWAEGPHIYRKDGWYYLVISEGGTFEDHMITAARSRDLFGPYEANEHNPIHTARGTNEYIQHTGHSDMFQDTTGAWWGVCLGVRKGEGGRYIMGRESFLTPVDWPEGGWPTFRQVRTKFNSTGSHKLEHGNSSIRAVPKVDLVYLYDTDLSKHKISDDGKTLALTAGQCDLTQAGHEQKMTFVGKRLRTLEGSSQVTMDKISSGASVRAGLAIVKDEHRFARIFYDSGASEIVTESYNKAKSISTRETKAVDAGKSPARFKVDYTEYQWTFTYQLEGAAEWSKLGEIDTLALTGYDFVGPIAGVLACSSGDGVEVTFRNLEVQ